MKPIILTALLLLTVLSATTADGQMYEPPRREANFGIYAAEAGGSILGALGLGGTFAVASILIPVMTDNYPNTPLEVFAGISGALGLVGCAGGTWLAGNGFTQQGRFLPSLACATGASAVGLGLCIAGTQVRNRRPYKYSDFVAGLSLIYTGVGFFVATPFVAVVGYNLSRPKQSVGGRFLPGSVALGSVMDTDGIAHPSLDVRLVTLRF